MCIAIITTAHPDYALIVVDNRDEFISRPTSPPHWWSPSSSSSSPSSPPSSPSPSHQVLSSRDLWRPEHGTWLGISRDGRIAVLTNYREDLHIGARSRGRIVSAWLAGGGDGAAPVEEQVHDLVTAGLAEYGGFTMVCGQLRRRRCGDGDGDGNKAVEGLAVVSNRSMVGATLPWVGKHRGETSVLSNTAFNDPLRWPKIARGKQLMDEAVAEASAARLDEDALVEKLFGVLSEDALSPMLRDKDIDLEGMLLQQAVPLLMHTVFVPPLGRPVQNGDGVGAADGGHWEEAKYYDCGVYGTQRQTIILVGWDGEVVYVERKLWDEQRAKRLDKGEDVVVRFKIEGW